VEPREAGSGTGGSGCKNDAALEGLNKRETWNFPLFYVNSFVQPLPGLFTEGTRHRRFRFPLRGAPPTVIFV